MNPYPLKPTSKNGRTNNMRREDKLNDELSGAAGCGCFIVVIATSVAVSAVAVAIKLVMWVFE